VGRVEDSELALDGHAMLKVRGKGFGLEALRKEVGARF